MIKLKAVKSKGFVQKDIEYYVGGITFGTGKLMLMTMENDILLGGAVTADLFGMHIDDIRDMIIGKPVESKRKMNHYEWLDINFWTFLENLSVAEDVKTWNCGIISAHGDKCYGYRSIWKSQNIPFEHGVAIYLLTYINPWADQTRNTENGWIPPNTWVIDNYKIFKNYLPKGI